MSVRATIKSSVITWLIVCWKCITINIPMTLYSYIGEKLRVDVVVYLSHHPSIFCHWFSRRSVNKSACLHIRNGWETSVGNRFDADTELGGRPDGCEISQSWSVCWTAVSHSLVQTAFSQQVVPDTILFSVQTETLTLRRSYVSILRDLAPDNAP